MSRTKIILIFFAFTIIGGLSAYVLVDIVEKQFEAKRSYFTVVEIGPLEDDPAVWGQNFPLQYESYLKTKEQVPTQFGGSEKVRREPTEDDPREFVSRSKLDMDPRLKTIWAGYPFAIDSREKRGHAHMLIDQVYTKRQQVAPQPAACLNCHSSNYVSMMELGQGDLEKGFDKLNKMPYHQGLETVDHPVSCIDCHSPQTMGLRVTRPAFKRGIKAFKASRGVGDYDVNRDASHREMRSFVCAQCHVNYHFEPESKELTYPWSKGLKVDNILDYYRENPHTDWVHPKTGGGVIKAQHPEFEMWQQGTHAQAGVSCVDCHMPYQREGAMKFTNHHIRSPLLNAQRSCMSCHGGSADDLLERVETIQHRHHEMLDTAMDALVELIGQLEKAKEERSESEEFKAAQVLHREAQFIIDFVEAENSSGFHAPQESGRVLMKALDKIRRASGKLTE